MNAFLQQGLKQAAETEAALRKLVSEFSSAPLLNGKRMRELLSADRPAFSAAALWVLRDLLDERGCRYLVTLLWTNDLLISSLTDPNLPRDAALRVAKTASKVDTQLHIRLMRFLTEGMLEGHELEESAASRLLEVLSVITDSSGIHPFLRQMLLHPSGRIRSKITLLMGKGSIGFRAVEKLLKDEDARVRANAVEALWIHKDPQALQLLREALSDSNNRVVGNAILGLHSCGDPAAVLAVLQLSQNESPLYRSTAAWTMGKTADARFLPVLGRMLVDSQANVRRIAFRSVAAIKKASLARNPGQTLFPHILECDFVEGKRLRLVLSLADASGAAVSGLRGTNFIPFAAGNPVTEYTLQDFRAESLAVAFVLPRRSGISDPLRHELEAGLIQCLDLKRRAEQWSILRYRESSVGRSYAGTARLLGQEIAPSAVVGNGEDRSAAAFTSNLIALRTTIQNPGLRYETGMGMLPTMQGLAMSQLPSRGTRHVIAILDTNIEKEEGAIAPVLKELLAANLSVHILSTSQQPEIEAICRQSKGFWRYVPDLPNLRAEIVTVYSALWQQYHIEFECEPGEGMTPPPQLKVQVFTEKDFGEDCWNPDAADTQPALEVAPESTETEEALAPEAVTQ